MKTNLKNFPCTASKDAQTWKEAFEKEIRYQKYIAEKRANDYTNHEIMKAVYQKRVFIFKELLGE
jgi:hypothetical protein